ncbi:MAG: sodium-dependent transporter, partial [Pseudomonadota bacterium]
GMGRKSGMSAIDGVQSLARAEGRSLNWGALGWIGSLTSFFILTFYMVISAWIVDFIPQAFSGEFAGFAAEAERLTNDARALDPSAAAVTVADVSGANFGAAIGNKPVVLGWLLLFIGVNTLIVARGVRGGIERAATILMPAFFVLLIGVVGFSLSQGDAAAAVDFLLRPDFSEVGFDTFLAAVGQAFFSLSVGSCLMITYGAYLSRETDIPRAAGIIASADTLVALVAGFAIFPIVFAFGANPAGGPGLFFVSLPIAFGQMPAIIGGAFFTLALFAALTSSISLMEVGVSWLEEREGVNRPGAAIGVGFVLFMVGAGYVYSTEFIDFVDFVTGTLMLPLGGLLVTIFAGRILSRQMLVTEFGEGTIMNLWRFAVRWVGPVGLSVILVFGTIAALQTQFGVELPGFLQGLLGLSAD